MSYEATTKLLKALDGYASSSWSNRDCNVYAGEGRLQLAGREQEKRLQEQGSFREHSRRTERVYTFDVYTVFCLKHDEVRSLIKGKADVNAEDGEPLRKVVLCADVLVLETLLEAKADPLRKNGIALATALESEPFSTRCVPMFKVFLKAGLDPNITISWSDKRLRNVNRESSQIALLDHAVRISNKELIDVLVLHGAVTTTNTLEFAACLPDKDKPILEKIKHVLIQETISKELRLALSKFRPQHCDNALDITLIKLAIDKLPSDLHLALSKFRPQPCNNDLHAIKLAIDRLQDQVSDIKTYVTSGATGHHEPPTTPAHSLRLAVNQAEITEIGFKPLQLFVDQPPEPLVGCRECVMHLSESLPSVRHLEQILDDVALIAEEKLSTAEAELINNPGMVFAIVLYTFDACWVDVSTQQQQQFYFQLNLELRKRSSLFLKKAHGYMYYLMTGLSRLPPLKGQQVFRGIDQTKAQDAKSKYKQGLRICWSAFSSASKELNTAVSFAGVGGLVLQIALLEEGSASRDISALSAVAEQEVILFPTISFIVCSDIKTEEGVDMICLQEVIRGKPTIDF